MSEVRGLQLARNDKAAASGLMTEARQDRSPAANAPSGAHVNHFTPATLAAENPQRLVGKVRMQTVGPSEPAGSPTGGVPKHLVSVPQPSGDGVAPALKGGASAPKKR
jgi:hypothetical protein